MGRMFKLVGLVVLVLVIASAGFNVYRNKPSVIFNRVLKDRDTAPEKLIYRAYLFGILPVGDVVFNKAVPERLKGKEYYYLSAKAETMPWISVFFSGKAELESYIDKKSYNPLIYREKIVMRGKPEQEKEVVYDQKNHFMTLEGERREILPDTQDPLSLIYNLSKTDFEKKKDLEININTNQKNYLLKGAIKSMPVIDGKYNVYLGKADIGRRDKNNPYHRSKISIWFVKMNDNIPIRISAFKGGALVSMRLVEVR
jgi:hypothetical protein